MVSSASCTGCICSSGDGGFTLDCICTCLANAGLGPGWCLASAAESSSPLLRGLSADAISLRCCRRRGAEPGVLHHPGSSGATGAGRAGGQAARGSSRCMHQPMQQLFNAIVPAPAAAHHHNIGRSLRANLTAASSLVAVCMFWRAGSRAAGKDNAGGAGSWCAGDHSAATAGQQQRHALQCQVASDGQRASRLRLRWRVCACGEAEMRECLGRLASRLDSSSADVGAVSRATAADFRPSTLCPSLLRRAPATPQAHRPQGSVGATC